MLSKFVLSAASCVTLALSYGFADEEAFTPKEIQLSAPAVEKKAPRKSPTVKEAFSPFTGKITGSHVRMRLHPDLDASVVKELSKDQLVLVTAQEGSFYEVQAPEPIKAFIFRSFVLDGIVEGNRVNVRLAPDLEAPIIGHHNTGDRVGGVVSARDKKWLEIDPPSSSHFYVAKELIDKVGGPELKAEIDQRKETVAQLLQGVTNLAKEQMELPFEEIDFDRIKSGFVTIINEYSEFSKEAKDAKRLFANVQEQYLDKRLNYLEGKTALASGETAIAQSSDEVSSEQTRLPSSISMWDQVEQGLFVAWSQANDQKALDEFYEEQRIAAVPLSGTLVAYTAPVNNKPGDYIIKRNNLPVAYIYSTQVDLDEFVGKKVTVIGSPRSNHNFAFPAYFVHEIE